MINGLFEELSEEEMLSVNGACAGGANPYAAKQPCQECIDKGNNYFKNVIVSTIIGGVKDGFGGAIAAFATSVITGVPGPHESH